MRIAEIWKRGIAFTIDIVLVLMLYLFLVFHISKLCGLSESMMQMLPFVIIEVTVVPLFSVINLFVHASTYGMFSIYLFTLIGLFVVEVIYFTLLPLMCNGCTFGCWLIGIQVKHLNQERLRFTKCLQRACVKVLTYFLFMIPLFALFFSDDNRTLHDMLVHTVMVTR